MPDPTTSPNEASRRARWTHEIRARLSSLRLSPAREMEIVDELSEHLEDRYADLISGAVPPDEVPSLCNATLAGSYTTRMRARRTRTQKSTSSK